MESFDGVSFATVGSRKKRSNATRRPCPVANLHCYKDLSSAMQPKGSGSHGDIDDKNELGNENKLKLKLKLGGVSQKTPNFQGKASMFCYPSREIVSGSNIAGNVTDKYEPTCKSKRAPKRRVLDVGFNSDDEEDAEMRYLGRLKASTGHTDYGDDDEEEKSVSDDDEYGFRRKKLGKSSNDSFMGERKNSTRTAHDHALIEFPDGLPLAPTKKQKEKLTDVEQQLKKARAAQRRKIQLEKAAREAEAEAIRKILGQDSGRKKKEEKMRKQRDELAQERASKSETLEPNTVRWVIGPTGTTVIFSKDVGLPNIFSSVPCSYPPTREKCAAPNCTNSYKYRDSKSKLPLCSLNCYKEIHEKRQTWIAC